MLMGRRVFLFLLDFGQREGRLLVMYEGQNIGEEADSMYAHRTWVVYMGSILVLVFAADKLEVSTEENTRRRSSKCTTGRNLDENAILPILLGRHYRARIPFPADPVPIRPK